MPRIPDVSGPLFAYLGHFRKERFLRAGHNTGLIQGKAEESAATLEKRYPERMPGPSEKKFFKRRPEVAGYAADDKKVVISPVNKAMKNAGARRSVLMNERVRQHLRDEPLPRDVPVEPRQREKIGGEYRNDPRRLQETVVARIIAGDDSGAPYTATQRRAARDVVRRLRRSR